jgi:hypothetical protein
MQRTPQTKGKTIPILMRTAIRAIGTISIITPLHSIPALPTTILGTGGMHDRTIIMIRSGAEPTTLQSMPATGGRITGTIRIQDTTTVASTLMEERVVMAPHGPLETRAQADLFGAVARIIRAVVHNPVHRPTFSQR